MSSRERIRPVRELQLQRAFLGGWGGGSNLLCFNSSRLSLPPGRSSPLGKTESGGPQTESEHPHIRDTRTQNTTKRRRRIPMDDGVQYTEGEPGRKKNPGWKCRC